MALFKEKIVKEQKQDEKTLNERYENFLKFQAKIDAIKGYKEEEYQTDFLHDIFEACLGYTLKTSDPQNFNLQRESKNETDGKKADGAILGANSEVIGVIELKDQKTHDLDKIENQAFNYHNSNSKSRYIIISNFDEIRLYIDKKTAYEKFSLFTMTRDEFELFHQIFCFENINSFKTIDLRDKSESSDREISKRLYADFSEFRLKLFENAISNNQNLDKKQILSLVQKFCDRIIFVLFAEDYGLLKSNFVADINTEWQNQKFTDFSLYEIWQKYFEAIDKGNQKLGVENGYNGGLFATDETLNSLKFSDEILQSYIAKLSAYDFASDIGVNILGHIFEQSLSDLEELNSQIIGEKFEKTNSKRKKDGIFYTPEYIVKFIISQTLGQICENEKSRLNLHEIAIPKNPKRLSKVETQTLENIRAYKEFLLGLKIIDPACGSGAFLNGALDFLINEHKNLDKFRKIYENEALPLYDIEPQILENNLFGVDINADAVQIAKLSLWLRTAQKGRKLTDLSNNIKCANSLLDFPFDFKFDIVIGNPPYVRQEMIKEQKPHLQKLYKAYCGTADLFVYFYELGLNLLKNGGLLGFICSNKFFRASYGQNLRELILQNSQILAIADFNGVKVFDDATVDSAITILRKNGANSTLSLRDHEVVEAIQRNSDYLATSKTANAVLDCFDDKSSLNDSAQSVIESEAKQSTSENNPNPNSQNSEFKLYSPNLQDFATLQTANLKASGFIFLNPLEANLKAKIERLGTPLKDWDININYGIKTGLNEAFIIDEATRTEILSGCESVAELERTKAIIKPILRGRDIKRYTYSWAKIYIIGTFPALHLDIDEFPSLKNYLSKFLPQIEQSGEKGCRKKTSNKWFETQDNIAYCAEFEKEKIFYNEIGTSIEFVLDTDKFYCNNKCYFITLKNSNLQTIKYFLAILNSKILQFLFKFKFNFGGGKGVNNFSDISIPKISKEKEAEFVNLVDKILKIKNQNEISRDDEIMLKVLDKELNSLVFALYDLSADEIALIENS
ncbi:Eco57I restriction-modification methylase domain-containing protein [Campylobacter sp. JMF_01 NE2]|uniref:Eco57I restriction-modification methylase domain-containing protein n=1 Tax=unclassified Campylobacter TaxID=2593542 RepID=UPI0022E9DCEA|nr:MULTISPECIES: N-6 DNA methylase [unclassified Campylobacter]MDA3052623.1 Eco57I restriction-modification methylase domain-containing protein [Campylobacter sp. JMF_03 NE3]MDA3066954.1 Eco57I restriction-modification methylase domain-containing protein [Campylobacter sp. JMF_01 NE2]